MDIHSPKSNEQVSLWRNHLSIESEKPLHFVTKETLNIEALSRACRSLHLKVFNVKGDQLGTIDSVTTEISRAIGTPFRIDNWDALFSSLRELDWYRSEGFLFVFSLDVESIRQPALRELSRILLRAGEHWSQETSIKRIRARPFHSVYIVESLDDVDLEILGKQVCSHKDLILPGSSVDEMIDAVERWKNHIRSNDAPTMHLVRPEPEKTEVVGVLSQAGMQLGFQFIQVNNSKTSSESGLIESVLHAARAPSNFGATWISLERCLTDLSWFTYEGFVLLLNDADSLLELPPNWLDNLLEILNDTVKYWRDDRGEWEERSSPAPFHVVFTGSEGLRKSLERSLGPMCNHRSVLRFM